MMQLALLPELGFAMAVNLQLYAFWWPWPAWNYDVTTSPWCLQYTSWTDLLVDVPAHSQFRELCLRHSSAGIGYALAKVTIKPLLVIPSLPVSPPFLLSDPDRNRLNSLLIPPIMPLCLVLRPPRIPFRPHITFPIFFSPPYPSANWLWFVR